MSYILPSPRPEFEMQGATKERWRELCEQAAKEQNPKKLIELVTEINRLLADKQRRLESPNPEK